MNNALRNMLLADGRLTSKERLSIRTTSGPTLFHICSELLMKIQTRLRWQDMQTDYKGNTIWPEGYDSQTHTWVK